jgi:HEAT repeat protein
LLDALADDDVGQQRIAIDVLSYVHNANAALPLFAYATGTGDSGLRARAMIACGALATPASVPRFAELLFPRGRKGGMAPPEPVAIAAVWGLARLHDRSSLPVLRRILREGSVSAQAIAALGVGLAGDRALSIDLAALLGSADTGTVARAAAAYALGLLDAEDRVDALLDVATDENPLARRLAMLSLARMAQRQPAQPAWVPRAVPVIADALFVADPEGPLADGSARAVALTAANSLALLAGGRAPTFPVALPVPEGGLDVEDLLGELGKGDMSQEDREAALVRFSAAIEQAAAKALHTSSEQGRAVLDAIGSGDGELRPFVGRDATGPAAAQAREIVQALGPSLPALARGPDPALQAKALLIVAKLDGEQAAEAVADAIASSNEAVRRVALAAVATARRNGTRARGGARTVAEVGEILASDGTWSIRVLAAEAMGRLGAAGALEEARTSLEAAAMSDRFALVRQCALESLATFDEAGARKLAIRMASRDSEPRVREVALALEGK